MRCRLCRVLPPPPPSPPKTPLPCAAWPNGAAATARGPHLMALTASRSRSPAAPICGAGKRLSPPISWPDSAVKVSPLILLSPTRWVRPGPMPDLAKAAGGLAILPSGDARAALAPLPVEALRLDPAIAQGLRRVGLKRIGDLYAMPRSALACRFGEAVAQRLDQAFDDLPEPLSPLGETPSRRVRLSFRRADRRSRRSGTRCRTAGPGSRYATGARGDRGAAAGARLSSGRRPGRASDARHGAAEPRSASYRRAL